MSELTFSNAVPCLGCAVNMSSFVSIKPLSTGFSKKQGVHYYAISYVYTKRWIFTYLWRTKQAFETVTSGCFRLESIFIHKLLFNVAVDIMSSNNNPSFLYRTTFA